MKKTPKQIILGIVAVLCLIVLPLQTHAKPVKASKEATKERIVLMPLRLSEEDKSLQGAMETALVKGLQQKYEVFSGEQVAKKAREIFLKESRNTAHTECDEIRCLQGIAEAFQAELLATANITKQDGGYFIALSIQNLYDNKVVQSESVACEGCNAFMVIEKLKEIVDGPAPVVSASTVEELKPGKVFKDCADCPEMVVVPAGSFNMGSNKGGDESPAHSVSIRQPFAMGKTEVTQGQWKIIMGSNPSKHPDCGDKCPVEQVSWNDAKEFIRKLNVKTGKQYRLPSEAEWEYACRAGKQSEYCGGDYIESVAWYYSNSNLSIQQVAQKQANDWGLYDMSGNVWEWVEDSLHGNYNGAPADGAAWQGDGLIRMLRGGGSGDGLDSARAAYRGFLNQEHRYVDGGFRVARTLP